MSACLLATLTHDAGTDPPPPPPQLASHISQSLKLGGAPYASNSLERLRLIKRLRVRAQAERLAAAARPPEPYAGPPDLAHRVAIDDFNDYT